MCGLLVAIPAFAQFEYWSRVHSGHRAGLAVLDAVSSIASGFTATDSSFGRLWRLPQTVFELGAAKPAHLDAPKGCKDSGPSGLASFAAAAYPLPSGTAAATRPADPALH